MGDTERLVNSNAPGSRAEREGSTSEMSEREAYFHALRMWIQQAQMYQNLSTCFPYFMMSLQGAQSSAGSAPLLNNNYQVPGQPWPPLPNAAAPPNVPEDRPPNGALTHAEVISRYGGYEYQIPPLYKRLLAEFIDFLLLFVMKLLVTFVAVDMLDLIDLEKFDLSKLSENLEDYQTALELTTELLILELIYRVMVCFYEAACLSVPRAGGATPGKAILGLRVISASAVIAAAGRGVLIYPAAPLSFPAALSRSLLKNLLISLLFPLCFALFVFRFNRTGYDLLCHAIVVEENMFPQRRHAP